ncbi:UPF0575 protein C19orf67-like [Mauremys reevesii]|uniref:UPF0575 protein C19orf67-like n=1 Tax=Mauremys reevesii TaxID=260615 RepID=UPI00193FB87F|nr:UPF0575 protein C19orf67-like [Mauremys reevesii]
MAGKQGYSGTFCPEGSAKAQCFSPGSAASLAPCSPERGLFSSPAADARWLSCPAPQAPSSTHENLTLEELLTPVMEKLKYLLKKAEDFQTYLLYSRDRMPKEQFAKAVPTFLQMCQPYFEYLESTARSYNSGLGAMQASVRKRVSEPGGGLTDACIEEATLPQALTLAGETQAGTRLPCHLQQLSAKHEHDSATSNTQCVSQG